jgi:hypothetical protein
VHVSGWPTMVPIAEERLVVTGGEQPAPAGCEGGRTGGALARKYLSRTRWRVAAALWRKRRRAVRARRGARGRQDALPQKPRSSRPPATRADKLPRPPTHHVERDGDG